MSAKRVRPPSERGLSVDASARLKAVLACLWARDAAFCTKASKSENAP